LNKDKLIDNLVEWLLKHDNEIVCLHPEKKIATEIITYLGETMKEDTFFTTKNCDRCKNDLGRTRIMSWFTTETICIDCSRKEGELKRKLRESGKSDMEGCGYVPQLGS